MLIRRMSDRRLRVSTNDFNDPSSNALYLRRASAMSVYSIASSYAETARQASRGVAVVLQIRGRVCETAAPDRLRGDDESLPGAS